MAFDDLETYEEVREAIRAVHIRRGKNPDAYNGSAYTYIEEVRGTIRDDFGKRKDTENHESLFFEYARHYSFSVDYIRKICRGIR